MTYTYTGYGGGGAWNYRKLVTIPRTAISGNHTNFPVLFKIKEIGKKSGFADGTDIIFVATDASSRYKHDLISFKDYSGCAYIQIPSLVDQNGTTNAAQFYMYYGNDNENQLERVSFHPSSAWENGYIFVCHMCDSGGNNSRLVDSTRYKVPLWKHASNDPNMVKSFMGSAQMWDAGSNSYISSNDSAGFDTIKGAITAEAIISGGGNYDTRGYIIQFHNQPTDNLFHAVNLQIRSNGNVGYGISANSILNLGTNVATGYWPKTPNIAKTDVLVASFNSGNATSPGHNRLFLAGTELVDPPDGYPVTDSVLLDSKIKGVYIGRYPSTSDYVYSGSILELRISKVTRVPGWHKTTYRNVSSMACKKYTSFYTIGAEEGVVGDVAITDSSIDGVTVPVTGETPDITVTECDQYTGVTSWNPTDDPFAASKVYTATITLTQKTGYMFTGVTANFFTVPGTSSPATNNADGKVVTAIFPATSPLTVAGLSTFDTVSGCKGVASALDWKWGKVLYGTSSGMRSSRTDGAGLDWSWHTIDGEAGYYVPSGSPTGWKWCVEYAGSS